ncbi:hypothetical protein TSAR_017021, partial [Trichomalopsis sarcophagae]
MSFALRGVCLALALAVCSAHYLPPCDDELELPYKIELPASRPAYSPVYAVVPAPPPPPPPAYDDCDEIVLVPSKPAAPAYAPPPPPAYAPPPPPPAYAPPPPPP